MEVQQANERIGSRARALRLSRDLSLEHVAMRASEATDRPLAPTVLSQLERGRRTWNLRYMVGVAAALEAELGELLSDEAASPAAPTAPDGVPDASPPAAGQVVTLRVQVEGLPSFLRLAWAGRVSEAAGAG